MKFYLPNEWEIEPYEGNELRFNTPAFHERLSMKFDPADYEEKGANLATGSMLSGRRVNAHTLDLTNKSKGK